MTGHITTMNEYNVLPQKRHVVKETVYSITKTVYQCKHGNIIVM